MAALYPADGIPADLDQRIAAIASRQHGVFSRRQAELCSATGDKIRWRPRTKRWEPIYPGVYRLAGSPRTWRQVAMAALLYFGPGTVLSHRAAVVLRDGGGRKRRQIEVTYGEEP